MMFYYWPRWQSSENGQEVFRYNAKKLHSTTVVAYRIWYRTWSQRCIRWAQLFVANKNETKLFSTPKTGICGHFIPWTTRLPKAREEHMVRHDSVDHTAEINKRLGRWMGPYQMTIECIVQNFKKCSRFWIISWCPFLWYRVCDPLDRAECPAYKPK